MVKEITSQEEFDAIMQSENADNVIWCPHCGKAYVIDWTDEEQALIYFDEVCEMTESEKEFFGIETESEEE